MDKLELLKRSVFSQRPELAAIYNSAGGQTIFNYVNNWPVSLPSHESEIFSDSLGQSLGRTYQADLAAKITSQFKLQPLISTIDHHGILNHPFFINSNLIFSLRKNLDYLICLSTSGVSLNNSSWPGCLLATAPDGQLKRFSFFPDKLKTRVVSAIRSINEIDAKKVQKEIKSDTDLSKGQKEKLAELAESIFSDRKIFTLPDFAQQACLISATLWPKIFPDSAQVIYYPLEHLVMEILSNVVIPDTDHILHRLFFNQDGWGLIEKYFAGSLGAFTSLHKGSFLFWAIFQNGRRVHLVRQGNKITNGELIYYLEPAAILKSMGDKSLYPTSLLCFLVLLWHGVTCVGGFNQVDWLSGINSKFSLLLREMGEKAAADRISAVPTANFAESNLAFLPDRAGLVKATGLDIILSGGQLGGYYAKLAKNISVGESLESLLPEIYKIVNPLSTRDNNLASTTDEDIMKANGMWKKFKSAN